MASPHSYAAAEITALPGGRVHPCGATTRAELIEREDLIDLCEWARMQGHESPFPVPAAITAALWEELERIPFRLAGAVTMPERVHHVVAKARAALELELRDSAASDLVQGVVLAFSASLPSTLRDRPRRKLHLFCGPSDDAAIVITIGVPDEIPPTRGDGGAPLSLRCAGLVGDRRPAVS